MKKEVGAVTIEPGIKQDIDSWMNLVERVRDAFPGLETRQAMEAHRRTVLEFMESGGAICAKEQKEVVGALLFSREHSMLCFLAVDARHRRQHIAENMVACMLTKMDSHSDILVTTYREDVPEGAAARAFYQRMGFTPGKLTEEFGSPVQEFVLKR